MESNSSQKLNDQDAQLALDAKEALNNTNDTAQPDAEELTDVEVEAQSHGWSQEGVEGRRNLSAEEFMDRQPLYDDIKSAKKQIKKLQEGMDALKSHHANVASTERAKVMAELKRAKKEALEDDNYDAVIQIDDKIAETRAEDIASAEDPASNPTFDSWEDNNKWYNQDDEMRDYADTIGQGYAARNPDRPLEAVYEYVSKEVKKRFPKKFRNPASATSSPVEGAQRGSRPSGKIREGDLPDQDRKIMNSIIRAGGITKEQYLKEYNELNNG